MDSKETDTNKIIFFPSNLSHFHFFSWDLSISYSYRNYEKTRQYLSDPYEVGSHLLFKSETKSEAEGAAYNRLLFGIKPAELFKQ